MNLQNLIRKGRLDPVLKTDSHGTTMLIGWRRKGHSRKSGEFELKKPTVWIDTSEKLTPGARIIVEHVPFLSISDEYADSLTDGQLVKAAACYVTAPEGREYYSHDNEFMYPNEWPLHPDSWRASSDRINDFMYAGALYLVEAERLKRAGRQDEAKNAETLAAGCARLIDDLYGVSNRSAGPQFLPGGVP